ncbi:MAG: hypothetical protein KatS3mg068_2670 [Candidatus Sericytochromatia bacterium]|nr:MAG: hypothetical protein KatS3mg068_2670 [Candidatus Sericytochromatia bacterium]
MIRIILFNNSLSNCKSFFILCNIVIIFILPINIYNSYNANSSLDNCSSDDLTARLSNLSLLITIYVVASIYKLNLISFVISLAIWSKIKKEKRSVYSALKSVASASINSVRRGRSAKVSFTSN